MTASVGIVETRYFTSSEPLALDSGATLPEATIAYECYGELNREKTNAILICHALSGDAHAAGFHEGDEKPGWWEIMVGPGKPIDTDKYFVICSNILAGCMGSTGPSSINPETGKPYGLRFPLVTIGDMVKAQKRLIDFLEIPKLMAVVGGSIGGLAETSSSIISRSSVDKGESTPLSSWEERCLANDFSVSASCLSDSFFAATRWLI